MNIVLTAGLACSILSFGALAANSPADLKKMDINDDGAIDTSEAGQRGMAPDQFKALDKDHDGRLTSDEVQHQQRPSDGTRQPSQEAPGRAEGPTEN